MKLSARQVALEVLLAVSRDDAYANLLLPKIISRNGLDSRDAGLATELAYGTLRGQGYYDAVLRHCSQRPLDEVTPALLSIVRMGAHQWLGMRVPAHAAVAESVDLARETVNHKVSGFVNAVLRRVTDRSPEQWRSLIADEAANETERLAVLSSHPMWIARALKQSLVMTGRDIGDLEKVLLANNVPAQVSLCYLPGLAAKPGEEGAQASPSEPHSDTDDDDATPRRQQDGPLGTLLSGRWAPTAVVMDSGDPGHLGALREGRVRVQDEGSQMAAWALAQAPLTGPDQHWLDLCAGPGGKAALLGALARERGAHLTAVEVAPHRAGLVEQALSPLGEHATVMVADGREIGTQKPDTFDRVLVDVPCTGLGALRRRPEARWRRTPDDLATLGPLQRQLLDSAIAATRPGGLIAYVTCSPHVAETSLVVEEALKRHPDVVPLDAVQITAQVVGRELSDLGTTVLKQGTQQGRAAQWWTDLHGTDSMFVALLQRN